MLFRKTFILLNTLIVKYKLGGSKMKKYVIISILMILFISIIGGTVQASPIRTYSEKPTEGIESSYADFGYSYNGEKNNNLSAIAQYGGILSYACEIYNVSSGYVKGFGKTNATMLVDEIGYTIYFQMWDGYQWANVDSITNIGYNTTNIQDYHFKTVSPNKYYRVNTEHYVIDSGIEDTTTSTSSYILVN
jgi:hypothetical protein